VPSAGGHQHFGWGFGSISPGSARTGPNGEGAACTYTAGPGAAQVFFWLDFWYQGNPYSISTVNGIRVAEEPNDYPWIGTGNFILVGSTASHPDNHYGQGWFLSLLRQLAGDYGNRWNLNLAYNDSSLVRGGRFDLNSNYAPPHYEHNIGLSQDVRANGGPSSIPFDPAIREWFEQRVLDLFGSSPLHESPGTSNEHYHIRG